MQKAIMPIISQTCAVLLGVLMFGLAGCSDNAAEKSPAPDVSSKATGQKAASPTNRVASAAATNVVALATSEAAATNSVPAVTPAEVMHIRACFDAIDNGRNAFAMRHARELMDSTNAEVRLVAIEAFGWIGRIAVNELAELMADEDEDVSSEAQRRWEMAFDEISSEVGKIQAIEKAAMLLKRQDPLEAVMMKLASIEDYDAVKLLCRIITSTNASPVAAEVARSEYASLAEEPFLDAKRAEQVVKKLANEEEDTGKEKK